MTTTMRNAVALVMLCSGSLLSNGCSLFATRAPSSTDPTQRCNTSEITPVLDASWAVVGAISVAAIALDSSYNSDRTGELLYSGGFTALFAASAAYGFSNVGKCRRREQEVMADEAESPKARPVLPTARDDAWQMTKQAQLAARNGDCATVTALSEVVSGMDAAFYRAVFVRDAGIMQCMTWKEQQVAPPGDAAGSAAPPAAPTPAPAGAGSAAPPPPRPVAAPPVAAPLAPPRGG